MKIVILIQNQKEFITSRDGNYRLSACLGQVKLVSDKWNRKGGCLKEKFLSIQIVVPGVRRSVQNSLDSMDWQMIFALVRWTGPVFCNFHPWHVLLFFFSGQPKGVPLRTANLLNRLYWQWSRFPLQQNEIGCHKTSPLFVDSLTEILGCLLQGVPLAIIDRCVNICRYNRQLILTGT